MASNHGAPVNKSVAIQLEKRKAVIEKQTGRTPEDLLYMNAKTGWIKLQSSVNTLSDDEVASIITGTDPKDVRGSNELAGYNILMGGVLRPDRGLREGIDTTGGYNENAAYNNRKESTGIRPMPGITSMTVKSKNTYGTLREADVKFSVWTLEDFEIMEKIYLRPGFSVLLEWGHSMYIDNDGVLNKDIETIGNHFFQHGVSMKQILGDIATLRETTCNNYEAMIGYVQNFSWTYSSNGGYECSVSIISTGEILESMQFRFDPRLRVQDNSKFEDSKSEEGKEQLKSIYHYVIQKLCKKTDYVFTKADVVEECGAFLEDLEDFTGYYNDVQLDEGWIDTEAGMHWIPLRTFFDLFNNCIAPIDRTKPKKSPDRSIVRFNIDYEYSGKLLTSPEHFSIDPTVCVLPFPAKLTTHHRFFGTSEETLEVKHLHDNGIAAIAGGTPEDVLNIYVSLEYLKTVLDGALDKDGKLDKSMHDIVETIVEGINTALGGVNDLGLSFDDQLEGGSWVLVDRNNTPPDSAEAPTFTLAGIGSVFTDVSISSKISNEIGSQISIAAQGSAQNTHENVENILKWNPGVVDRMRVTKDISSKEEQTKVEIEDDTQERVRLWLLDVVSAFDDFSSNDGYKKEDMEAIKTMHAEWTVTNVVKKFRTQNKQPIPGLVPVELSFKTDGIGGFIIGQAFKIAGGVLPSKYQDKFGYLITGLEHSVGTNNRWETSVTTQFYIIESPSDIEVAAAGQPGKTSRQVVNEAAGIAGPAGAGNNKPSVTPPKELIDAMKRYGITSPVERAHFLAQCSHESGGFAWKKEFASGAAYEFRKDLGNTRLGDGVKFKGRGYIQITGRANYQKYQDYLKKINSKVDIMTSPETLQTNYFAADSACYWWKYLSRGISSLAAAGTSPSNVKSVTKRVNGGTNGLADRQQKFDKYWETIQKNNTAYT
jgi:putative chitinase